MPAVILLRHAKSDWDADYGSDDRDRPLNKRGRAAAATIGRLLASSGNVPTEAITSPATRALETLHLAMEAGGWSCPVEPRPVLYGASASEVVAELRRRPDTTDVLLVVGHEPTTSDTASVLTGGGRLRVATATVLRIEFDAGRWADVAPGGGTLAWLVPPRLLG
ncbi:MAG: SixA phosphatase family protein [Acidimicrobiales bacterium]